MPAMNLTSSIPPSPETSILSSELGRQRLVAGVLTFTENTPLAPSARELALLDSFVHGELTIDEVVARLEDEA
ncbi:MAG: hypothetical protein JWR44_2343 [Hymenobacter sp.]|jgi:hypothetical protein|nr:hypothetical protein [Hymenobacter sp.]